MNNEKEDAWHKKYETDRAIAEANHIISRIQDEGGDYDE